MHDTNIRALIFYISQARGCTYSCHCTILISDVVITLMNRHYTAVPGQYFHCRSCVLTFITLLPPRVNIRAESTSYLRIVSFIEIYLELLDRMNACGRYTESKCLVTVFSFSYLLHFFATILE